jgi:hypothetical protein
MAALNFPSSPTNGQVYTANGKSWTYSSALSSWLGSGVAVAGQIPINAQTGTTYTLVVSDAGYCVEMNNASSNTLTVPPNSSVAFPVGTNILVRQMGAGLTTIAAGAGVTIRTPLTLAMKGQYATASLHKRATDEWCFDGNIT